MHTYPLAERRHGNFVVDRACLPDISSGEFYLSEC